jgi:hypothetical protein
LPGKQSFFKGISIQTDPVAVFSKLSEVSLIESVYDGDNYRMDDSISIISAEKYKSVEYKVHSKGMIPIYRGGFEIQKGDETTRVIWYYRLDSLSYPVDRWKGLYESVLLKRMYNQNTQQLKNRIIN